VYSMVSASGIEMASGRSECGAVAFANIVDVDAMLTRSELGDGYGDLDAVRDGREVGVANGGSLGVDDVGMSGLGSGGSRSGG